MYGSNLIWANVSGDAPANGSGSASPGSTPKSGAQAVLCSVMMQLVLPVLAMFY